MDEIAGSFTRAKGFLAGSAGAGLKTAAGALDIAVFASEVDAGAAGVFTTNRVCAAPVIVSRKKLAKRRARAIVVNAGNANACTGKEGLRDAERMAARAAEKLGVSAEKVLVASTGVIGRRLPMDRIIHGIGAAVDMLGSTLQHDSDAARAIMTTDTVPKEAAAQERIGGATVTVGGLAKGAGMIAPNLATMLTFVSTDCAIEGAILAKTLVKLSAETFNCVTVDGDMSTNDSVFVLANGCAGNRRVTRAGKDLSKFEALLKHVMGTLARAIAADGEGATKFIEIVVKGARTKEDAHRAAKAIAESPLVKTAFFGEDPNWGRILTAAGYSGALVFPEKATLVINGETVYRRGKPLDATPALIESMRKREIRVEINLGAGKAEATVWTCDLSHGYIQVNAAYHT
ncbi:MAG: bifunctional glutamate N-acetyltransferase/amino-acid acetyltransferase ArgJ [Planctomycetota bacterium]